MTAQGWGRWQVAVDCKVEHSFCEEGWRPRNEIGDHEHWVNAPDQKYIVFKRTEFIEQFNPNKTLRNADRTPWEQLAIYDAVVIRTQDEFAGPALHTYAQNIQLAARLMKDTHAAQARTFSNIADYFHFRALEADNEAQFHPKLPD